MRNKKWLNPNLTCGTSTCGRSLLLRDKMKKLLCIAILLLIPSWCFALAGYTNHKIITLTGSSAASASAGYVVPIRVSPDADPVETGSWTLNSKTYRYRVPITITESTGSTFADNYACLVEINTKVLYQRGFIVTGNSVEFYDGTNLYNYYVFTTDYNTQRTGFNNLRTRYYVKLHPQLTASEVRTIYVYFDKNITSASTNSKTMADVFTTYIYGSRTTSNLSDVYYNKWGNVTGTCGSAQPLYFNRVFSDDNITFVGFTHYYSSPSFTWVKSELGFHFTGVNLPPSGDFLHVIGWGGANLTVTSAQGLGYDEGITLSTEIVAEAADNAAIFSTQANYTGRSKSTTVIPWNITSAWTNGITYSSPDITTFIQSVTGRAGWTSGNSINLYWRQTSACSVDNARAIYPYNLDPSKAPLLTFTAYLHPDYTIMPKVNMPAIIPADVFLDGNSSAFPYDVAFTASDGTTQLYQADMPETLVSDTKQITFGVKTTATIPQKGNITIKIWYTNPSQTTRHSYWNATNTFTFFDDFETGIRNWTAMSGTWVQGAQQKPIIKGGLNGWSRAGAVFKAGSTYNIIAASSVKWNDFGMYIYYELPWKKQRSLTTNLTGYWYTDNKNIFEDRSILPSSIGQTFNFDYNCITSVATNDNGATLWMLYFYGGYHIGLAKSTDGGSTWTASSAYNPLFTCGEQGTQATGCEGELFWDADHLRWIMYVDWTASKPTPMYAFLTSRGDTSPEDTYAIYGSSGTLYNMRAGTTDYSEGIRMIKDGITWYYFSSNSTDGCWNNKPSACFQRVVYATANSPLGNTSTHKFTDMAEVTMPAYEGTYAGQTMSGIMKDGSDYYMVYSGQPQSALNWLDTGDLDNFIYLSKATLFPTTWEPQNVKRTLSLTTADATDMILKTATSYSNIVINTNFELPYNSNNFCIVFRYQDDSNYYFAMVDKPPNVSLWKMVSGSLSLISFTPLKFTPNPGTFYPLRIGLYGNQITIQASQYGTFWDTYIDVPDASLATRGKVGFMGFSSKINVDDIAISPYIYPDVSVSRAFSP